MPRWKTKKHCVFSSMACPTNAGLVIWPETNVGGKDNNASKLRTSRIGFLAEQKNACGNHHSAPKLIKSRIGFLAEKKTPAAMRTARQSL